MITHIKNLYTVWLSDHIKAVLSLAERWPFLKGSAVDTQWCWHGGGDGAELTLHALKWCGGERRHVIRRLWCGWGPAF